MSNIEKMDTANEFLVDASIWEKLPWSGWNINKNGYVSCCGVMLHHVVMYLNGIVVKIEEVVDHRNRNRLDNRSENLRVCTPVQNSWNCEKQHGHKLKNGKWRFTFSKSYPTMADAEQGLVNEGFQYMSKNRTCFSSMTFDTYDEGIQWWRFQAGIHYGEYSPFANPYMTCEEIVKESCGSTQQPRS